MYFQPHSMLITQGAHRYALTKGERSHQSYGGQTCKMGWFPHTDNPMQQDRHLVAL